MSAVIQARIAQAQQELTSAQASLDQATQGIAARHDAGAAFFMPNARNTRVVAEEALCMQAPATPRSIQTQRTRTGR